MPPTRLYLDTSVINFLLADDAPEKRDVTIRLFQLIRQGGRFEVFTSTVTEREIERTRDPLRREALLAVLKTFPIEVVRHELILAHISSLEKAYVVEKVLPMRSVDDAAHMAVATYIGADMLVSWNQKHLANFTREQRFAEVNRRLGWPKTPRLITPFGLVHA